MSGISKRVNGSWISDDYGIMGTSTDTLTTLPAVLYPNDTTATVGLKGQAVQSGTPSPTSPVMPQGTGERTRNLFDVSAKDTNNGYISDGYLKSDGSKNENASYRTSEYIAVSQSQSYTLVYGGQGVVFNAPSVCFYDSSKNFISGVAYGGRMPVSFTTPQNTAYLRISFREIDSSNIMLNTGSTAKPYEPHGYKLDIKSANTTTPVYLGEVQTTRQIKKLVLTGEESFGKNSGSSTNYLYHTQRATTLPMSIDKTPILCNELPVKSSAPQTDIGINTDNQFSVAYFNFGADVMNAQPSGNTIAGLKEYLASQYAAGTPVTVWYVLATETTGIVNEPLMRIGEYADTLNSISIPVTAGGDTISVDTTVQPSEVTATYKGWHPVQNVHKRDNGAWT